MSLGMVYTLGGTDMRLGTVKIVGSSPGTLVSVAYGSPHRLTVGGEIEKILKGTSPTSVPPRVYSVPRHP